MGDEHHKALQLSNELLWQASMLPFSPSSKTNSQERHIQHYIISSELKRNLAQYTNNKLTVF
jgi:hypothetical protein